MNGSAVNKTPQKVAVDYGHRKLPWIRKIGFGFFQLANVADFMITTWLMYYYTTFIGMSIVFATMLFSISKIIGSVVTPFYGYLSDRLYGTRFGKRFGRRKGLILIGIPLKTILFFFMWLPNMPIPVYWVDYLLYYCLTPMLSTTQLTFMSEMTQDSKQRADLAGVNQACGSLSGIIASTFIIYLFKIFGQNSITSYFISAQIYNVLSAIFLVVFYFSVTERPYDSSTDLEDMKNKNGHVTLRMIGKNFVEVFWNFISACKVKSFLIYFGMYICEQLFRSMRGNINTYFIVFALLLTPTSVAGSTTVGYIFGILFIFFFAWATRKTNGAFTYRIGSYAAILVLATIGIVAIVRPAHLNIWWMVLISCLNFGIAGVVNSTQYLFSFIPDVDEMVTSKRREGTYAGIQATLDTLFSTLEIMLIGFALGALGFQSKASTQPRAAVYALIAMYSIVPIIMLVCGTICSYHMHLDGKAHKVLLDEVIRLRKGGDMADVKPETKKYVELLTGIKYEQCWGHNNVMDFAHNHNSKNDK